MRLYTGTIIIVLSLNQIIAITYRLRPNVHTCQGADIYIYIIYLLLVHVMTYMT